MKNTYRVEGSVTYVSFKHLGELKEFMIDTEDLDKVYKFAEGNTWYADSRKDMRYVYIHHKRMVDGVTIRNSLHRIIMDAPKGLVVDHINHNTLDNRKQNLRVCTHAENMKNSIAIAGTDTRNREYKSGYQYVSWASDRSKWVARYECNGIRKRLGAYNSAEEANAAVLRYLKTLNS